jgi:hypothetical protein
VKVIAYMTLGIDVSRVFSEMVMVRGHALPASFARTQPVTHARRDTKPQRREAKKTAQ